MKVRKILIMDDEQSVLDITALLLQHLGYEVLSARDGEEALLLFNESNTSGTPPDLTILDLNVGHGKGGLEIVGELIKNCPDMRCIATSGIMDDDIIEKCRSAGFTSSLEKPYGLAELKQAIDAIADN